ncbi:MAG: hypothetical protein RQ757_08950 [Pseudomonadales bacterium]|nr:hypothetical protein [Pseudomonadales bacterium]
MKKTILLTLLVATIVINLAAWGVDYYSSVYIALPFRIALILGITAIAAIFSGAAALVNAAEQETPANAPRDDAKQKDAGPE